MTTMPTNPIQHLIAVGLVVTGGLAATAGASSAPVTEHRLAADAAQANSNIAFVSSPVAAVRKATMSTTS
jgi:hypothetical protein